MSVQPLISLSHISLKTSYGSLSETSAYLLEEWMRLSDRERLTHRLFSQRRKEWFEQYLSDHETTPEQMSADIRSTSKYGDGLWDEIQDPEAVITAFRRRKAN